MKLKDIIGMMLFPVLGIGLLLGSVFSLINTKTFLKNSISTSGTIIEIVMKRTLTTHNGHQSYYYNYYPKVSFTADDGKEYTFVSNVGSSSSPYTLGQNVKILYDQQNPQNARINSFFSIWFGTSLFFIIGLGFLIVGLGTDVSFIRKNKDSQASPPLQ